MKILRWLQLVLGAWIIISPWLLGFSGISIMMWSNVVVGMVIVLSEVWILFDSIPPTGEKKK